MFKHDSHLVCYLLTLGTLSDMFPFTWNHHQALFRNMGPLHVIIKTRYGIPYAYIDFKFAIHISLFSYYWKRMSALDYKTLRLYSMYVFILFVSVYKMFAFCKC